MGRGIRVRSWLLGIAMLTAVLGLDSPVGAAGIKVTKGGIKQFGDPFYFYIVNVYLDPGFEFLPKDSLTLHALAGVKDPGSTTGAPGGNPSGPWATMLTNLADGPIPNYSPTTIVPFADVTFINAFNVAANTGATEMPLGQFKVLTAVSLPVLPSSYFVDVFWTANLHKLDGTAATDSGTVRLTVIPEPSSVILLGVGVGLPACCWHRRRRRLNA